MPALGIDVGIGVIDFVMSLGWGKVTRRDLDRNTILFLSKTWSGIAIFGMIIVIVM